MKIVSFLMSFPFLYRRRIIYAVRKRRNIYGRHSLVSETFVVAWIQVMIHIIKSKALFPLWAAKWFNRLFWSQSVTQDFKGEKGMGQLLEVTSFLCPQALGGTLFTPVPNRTILTGAFFPWIGKLPALAVGECGFPVKLYVWNNGKYQKSSPLFF